MVREVEQMTNAAVDWARRALTWLYHVQDRLPPSLAKQWRLIVTLLLQLIPAIDPTEDPLLVEYSPPSCTPYDHASKPEGVLITGGTGLVGVHLIDHLLRTTSRPLFCIVRTRSAGKLRKEAAKYKLTLPGFDARVTLLDGDCKKADLGLSVEQWHSLSERVGMCFHMAANSSFIATFEILRGDWMPSCAPPRLDVAPPRTHPSALSPRRPLDHRHALTWRAPRLSLPSQTSPCSSGAASTASPSTWWARSAALRSRRARIAPAAACGLRATCGRSMCSTS